MERFLGVFVPLIIFAMTVPSRPASATATPSRDEVDEFVEDTLAELPIAGMAVAVVESGEVVHLAGYGTADEDGAPVTAHTPFPVASVTKSLTSLAARQLAADGRLELSTPVQLIVPEFRLDDPTGGADVTVQDLMDHTSGISTYEGTRPYLHDPDQTFAGAVATLAEFQPAHSPGTVTEYSNWNAVLLGEVIARAGEGPYVAQVTERILRPLGMDSATFADPHQVPGVATGNLLVLGFRRPFDEAYVPVMEAAGNLTASITDLAHYARELATGGVTVLPAEGRGWYDTVWNWRAAPPADVAVSFSGAHNGFNATIQLLPAHDVAVVVLANTRLDVLLPTPTTEELSLELARLVAGQPAGTFVRTDVAGPYLWLDTILGLLGVAALWQLMRLPGWAGRYRRAGAARKALTWTGIAASAFLATAVAAAPAVFDTSWLVVLDQRAIVAWPILAVAGLVVLAAVAKVVLLCAAPSSRSVEAATSVGGISTPPPSSQTEVEHLASTV
jgi:CubicO group peptidase (beta-lactamase class C family)